MGFAEVLTLIFITLKLTGYIDWSWWYVLMPEIIALSILFALFGFYLIAGSGISRPSLKRKK